MNYFITHITESEYQYNLLKVLHNSILDIQPEVTLICLISIKDKKVKFQYSDKSINLFYPEIVNENSNYIINNRHYCVNEFIKSPYKEKDVFCFVDPDMILNKKVDFTIGHNEIKGQTWNPYQIKTDYDLDKIIQTVRYPFVCTFKTLKLFAKDYLNLSIDIFNKTNLWESDMFGLSFSLIDKNIEIICDNEFGMCNDWYNRNENSTFYHYCQPVKVNNKEIFKKQSWDFKTPISLENITNKFDISLINKLNKYVLRSNSTSG